MRSLKILWKVEELYINQINFKLQSSTDLKLSQIFLKANSIHMELS